MVDAVAMAETPRLGLLRAVTIVALVSLPFMTALTINVGFPLKIYEVALLVAMVLVPLSGRLSFPQRAWSGAALTAAWIALAGLILIFRLSFPLPTVNTVDLSSRFGPVGDGITKYIYLLLDLFAFILFARFAARNERGFVKYWLFGACLAATYSFYLCAMNMVGIEQPPLLPSANSAQVLIAGRLFIRCATFREGNEAGLYFVISALLALHARYRKTSSYLLAAVVTTFSTLALLVVMVVVAWQIWRYADAIKGRVRLFLRPLIVVVAIGVGAAFAGTALFQSVVVGKLTSDTSSATASRVERLVFANAALDMFLDHPFLGVGVAQFGYNFLHYSDYPVSGKPVPNVVYLEFLSEDGLIVFAIFLAFFYQAFRRTRGEVIFLRAAFLSLTLSFFAYATISVMFIWALFGFLFGRQEALQAARRP